MTRSWLAALLAFPTLTLADIVMPEAPPAPEAAPAAAEKEAPAKEAPAAEAPVAAPKEAKKKEKAEAPAAKEAPATAGALAVTEAKLGTAIEEREPTGVAEAFPGTVGKIYFWTKVTGGAGSEVTHVWYHGDEKVSEVKLPLKFASVRTWSAKTISPDATGDWKVEVTGPDGAVLKSVTFKVN